VPGVVRLWNVRAAWTLHCEQKESVKCSIDWFSPPPIAVCMDL
jgi:hypothetical protein